MSAPDPDYTVGLRLELDREGSFSIRHIVRMRRPGAVEQEPGASGAA